ncbi:MAG: radical SAM protein [Candidatus Jordarchaeales archaeon]|nr:radical SAM protein [Candidatus Jordarchaeia archaeon]
MTRGLSRHQVVDYCFECGSEELRRLLGAAYRVRSENFPNTIQFYFPGMVHFEASFHRAVNPYRFPAVSVTGKACQLNCDHCKGRLLRSMMPAKKPRQLYEAALKVKKEGGAGVLVSGGSLADGSVPLKPFFSVMRKIKDELGLSVVVHTGLVDEETAEGLASAGVDCAMIDVVGSNETIREILHLNRGVEEYIRSLELLELHGVPLAPHIVVGLHRGMLRGEREALKAICERKVSALVIVVLTPFESTESPPSIRDALRVIVAARMMKPKTPLLLGCARPKGKYKDALDVLSIKAGVNGIAYPSEVAYRVAVRRNLSVKLHDECCSLAWRDTN